MPQHEQNRGKKHTQGDAFIAFLPSHVPAIADAASVILGPVSTFFVSSGLFVTQPLIPVCIVSPHFLS